MPESIFIKVLFPAPFSPTIPCTVPFFILRFIFFSTCTPEKDLYRFLISISKKDSEKIDYICYKKKMKRIDFVRKSIRCYLCLL